MADLKNITIGLDGKKALNNLTGIGNYSRFVINNLASRNPEAKFILFSPKSNNRIAKLNLQESKNISITLSPFSNSLRREWWRCYGIVSDLKQKSIDLYHGLSNELPFGIHKSGVPSIVTIHDLIFLRYPQTFNFWDRNILKLKVKYACLHADKIIAISQQTKNDIINYYHVDEQNIEVILQGCAANYYIKVESDSISEVKQRYKLPEKYILTVGTIEKRKNHKTIINALASVPDIPLVIVSKKTKLQEELEKQIKKLNLSDRVHIVNNVSNQDLPAVYQGASLCIYLSFFEGFGIPILEGIASNIPVIAAKGSCLEEAGGDACAYCEPFDESELAKLITKILSDEQMRNTMIAKGTQHIKKFKPEVSVARLEKCYENLLKQRR